MPVDDLRRSPTMAHLLDSLDAGKDIGHYGRLTFVMVARRFMSDEDVAQWLMKDKDVDETKARTLVEQVAERDYNPPRRERLMEWQQKQDFPIIPNPDDPDEGNLYRELDFPDKVYEHIEEYREEKHDAHA